MSEQQFEARDLLSAFAATYHGCLEQRIDTWTARAHPTHSDGMWSACLAYPHLAYPDRGATGPGHSPTREDHRRWPHHLFEVQRFYNAMSRTPRIQVLAGSALEDHLEQDSDWVREYQGHIYTAPPHLGSHLGSHPGSHLGHGDPDPGHTRPRWRTHTTRGTTAGTTGVTVSIEFHISAVLSTPPTAGPTADPSLAATARVNVVRTPTLSVATLWSFHTPAALRRLGAATALVHRAAWLACDHNADVMALQVLADNHDAQRFWETVGFTPHHTYTFYTRP